MVFPILAMVLAAQALPAPEATQGWQPLIHDASGDSHYDPASVRRDGDFARLIVRVQLVEPGPGGMSLLVSRLVINCPARTIGVEAADFYAADGRLGLSREIPPAQRRMDPLTDSVQRAAHERACTGAAGPSA